MLVAKGILMSQSSCYMSFKKQNIQIRHLSEM